MISRLILAAVATAIFFAFACVGEVHAQTNQYGFSTKCTNSDPITCNKEEAYTTCEANRVALFKKYPNPSSSSYSCQTPANGNRWSYYYNVTTPTTLTEVPNAYYFTACPSGTSWDNNSKTCSCPSGQIKNSITGQCMQSCSSRAEFSESSTASTGQYIPNGSVGCNGGCMYMHYNNPDGTATGTYLGDESYNHCFVTPTCDLPGWYLSPGTGMCQPPKPECKANQTKNPTTGECQDACPVGMTLGDDGQCEKSKNTCPAGQVQAPDGSCVQDSCPAGQSKGADGTCKKSTDSDKDEGDDDKYFGGGDDCAAPPSCSGDPILCGQARIQWRIDCNTRRNTNVSGGSCAAMPVCTGEKCDAVEYAQLVQQWRTTCAVEKLADGATGEGEQPSWTRVDGMNQDAGAGQTADDTKGVQTKTLSTSDLDAGGWLGGVGSCPSLIAAPGGNTIGGSFAQSLASPPSWFCNFVGAMSAIILTVASVAAAYILSKG